MSVRVFCFIGFLGLNISYLVGQEDSWERHLQAARKLHAQALLKDAEKEYLAALQDGAMRWLPVRAAASTRPSRASP